MPRCALLLLLQANISAFHQLITKHIDDVEAFGDIGAMNTEAIAKALAKNRCLCVMFGF